MSQDVEIMREIYEHINQRDWAAILATFDEEVVLVVHESVGPNAGIFRGREAVGRWFGDWFLAFGKDYRFQVEEARSVGDRVLIVARHHGHGRSSGVQVERVTGEVHGLRGGKIVHSELCGSRTEALEAIGLAE